MKTFNKYLSIISFALFGVLLTSCNLGIVGNGNVEVRDEQIDKFSRLEIDGNFDVFFLQAKKAELRIEADENLQDIIKVRQSGSTLIIEAEENIVRAKKKSLYITFIDLEKIDINGAIDIKCESPIEVETLGFSVSGAVKMNLKLIADKLRIDVSGATDCDLEGAVEQVDLELSGAGNFNAIDLKTKRMSVELSGAAHARVYATDELSVDISGAGSIRYKGDPEIRKNISGVGSLKRY